MAVIEDKRLYTMLDAELCMFTSDLCNNLTRDLTDLSPFGITAPKIAALKALGDAFEVFPPDDALLGDLMVANQSKNDFADQVRETIRNMALRVQITWGVSSGQYKSLGDLAVSKLIEDVLLTTARNVHVRMTGYLLELSSAGLTQDMLDDFEDLNESYELARNEVTNKIEERDIKTKERVRNGNELYGFVVNYCEIGKRVYENTNLAKYNDYVIYGAAPAPVPGKIQNLAYNPTTAKFTWQADTKATSYQIETSPDGVEWLQIYEGSAAEYVNTQGPGTGIARCRGVNDNGSGSWSDNLDYTVPVPVPNIVSVGFDSGNNKSIVTFNTVAFADLYLIYQSVVPIGNPAGAFDEIGTPTSSPFYTVSANNAMREYYYIKASYNDVLSVQSNIVFLDVPIV